MSELSGPAQQLYLVAHCFLLFFFFSLHPTLFSGSAFETDPTFKKAHVVCCMTSGQGFRVRVTDCNRHNTWCILNPRTWYSLMESRVGVHSFPWSVRRATPQCEGRPGVSFSIPPQNPSSTREIPCLHDELCIYMTSIGYFTHRSGTGICHFRNIFVAPGFITKITEGCKKC